MRPEEYFDQYEEDAIPIKRPRRKTPEKDIPVAAPVDSTPRRSAPLRAPSDSVRASDQPIPSAKPVQPIRTARPVQQTAAARSAQQAPASKQDNSAQSGRAVRQTSGPATQKVGVAKNVGEMNRTPRAARNGYDVPRGRTAATRVGTVKTQDAKPSEAKKTGCRAPAQKPETYGSIKTVPVLAKPKKKIYRKALLIYLGVLFIASIIAILLVRSNLKTFNAHDIENCLYEKTEAIKKAAAKGDIESEIEFDQSILSSVQSDQVLGNFEKAVANGSLDFKKNQKDSSETGNSVYDLFLNGFRLGRIEYKLVKEGTLALLPPFINLPLTEWELVSCKADVLSFELPSSCAVYQGDTAVEGIPSENEGFNMYYFTDNMTITDSIGNRAELNAGNKIDLNEYTAKIRSDYKLYYGDTLIDPSKAVEKTINDAEISIPGINLDMETVREYAAAFPTMSVYNLFILDKGEDISVKAADGTDIEFKQNGTNIKAYAIDLEYSDTLPAGLAGSPDPLKIAETWSLFMSQDLTGPSNGFATLAQYLVKDSYLYESMWKYANSIDITFTSTHTLDNPPFPVEKMTDFVKFSDTFFACNIELEKPMNLSDGQRIVDTFDSTFYFAYVDDTDDGIDNPHWAAAARYDR